MRVFNNACSISIFIFQLALMNKQTIKKLLLTPKKNISNKTKKTRTTTRTQIALFKHKFLKQCQQSIVNCQQSPTEKQDLYNKFDL